MQDKENNIKVLRVLKNKIINSSTLLSSSNLLLLNKPFILQWH